MDKNIAVIGLGLIGGSFAKSFKANTSYKIYGFDKSKEVLSDAISDKSIDFLLKEEDLKEMDFVVIALYPKDTIKFVNDNINKFKKGCIVIDSSGVKETICSELSKKLNENGIYFIGAHPMAGIEKSGYNNSFAHLFDGAVVIFCKDEYTNTVALKAAEMLFLEIGFLRVTITSAKEHDRIIAFTSQLAHVVSNAYVKSNTAKQQMGFSADSYKDLTRVAYLNENMWSELFLLNKENLIFEIDEIIKSLKEYKEAIKEDDEIKLRELLFKGKKAKERAH